MFHSSKWVAYPHIPPQEAETCRYTSTHFQSQWFYMKDWQGLVAHHMNHYGGSGNTGANTQSQQPFSKLCLLIWRMTVFWVPLCVKKGYVLHFLQMEKRNSLLKCFQHRGVFNDALLYQMPSLNVLYQLYQRREIWSSPISDVQEEGTNSSSYAPAPECHATVGPGGA